MRSKARPASSKRAKLPKSSDHAKSFVKDWQRLSRSGRFDLGALKHVMLLLIADDEPLPPQCKDHALIGNWSDHRECHIGGDFLLIYRATEDSVLFVRCDTHAELFE